MKLVYLAISLFLLNLFNAFLNFFIVDFVSVDICECAAGDCVGGSRGTCFTRDHLGNPRQPPQRVWSRISHRSTHILFSCGQTCSNADASTRGKANLILQSNSSSWMERFWPLCLNFGFFFLFSRTSFPWSRFVEGVCLPPMTSVSTCWSTSYCLCVSDWDVPERVLSQLILNFKLFLFHIMWSFNSE